MSQPSITVTVDRTKEVNDIVKRFRRDGVLVGIPQSETERSVDEGGAGITNAALLAISEFGSPLNNIPARNPMSTGLKMAADAIAEEFKKAAQKAFSKGISAISQYYARAGMIAVSSIKNVINQQIDMQGPAESTLKSRQSRGFAGTKSLLVTGQMRNAITYVVTGYL